MGAQARSESIRSAMLEPAPSASLLVQGILLGIFFLSGFCALTYEVAWTRLLDYVLGVC
jgi:hypothetical protein